MHVGPPILLFYYFTISLQIQYCRGRCLGLAARNAKSFPRTTTHHHVLPRTTAERSFASRTANLACRPSYSIFFTNLIFYYFTPDTVLPRPMFGVGRPRCEKIFHVLPRTTTYYHVLPRTTAECSFCISDGQPCMSALLFYCFTILLFHSRYSTAAADVWGWPPEMQKSFPRTTTYTYYHVLQQNVVFASRTANRKHRPQSFCISDGQPQTSVAEFLHLGRPTANIGLKVFASLTAIPACRPAFLHVGRTHPFALRAFGFGSSDSGFRNPCRARYSLVREEDPVTL